MDGFVRDPRLRLVWRSYAPTRLCDDLLKGIYDRVFQVRLVDAEVSEPGEDVPAAEPIPCVLTGGQHA
jgi:hypothetical protein